MTSSSDHFRYIASFLGATGVGLGAAGSHGLKKMLLEKGLTASWNTAITYQLFHAAAILGVSALCKAYESGDGKYDNRLAPTQLVRAGNLLAAGSLMFSGSIFMLCFGIGPKKIFGPATPVGGLLLIGGWTMLGLVPSSSPPN